MTRQVVANFIKVTGLVQGVGFRPFVLRLARRLKLTGSVLNAGGQVHIYVWATPEQLTDFLKRLRQEKPGPSRIDHIEVRALRPNDLSDQTLSAGTGFEIVESCSTEIGTPLLPADQVTCPACLADLRRPTDPRYRYPFISCTLCGPRYSVMTALPYDRERTTMSGFSLCPACESDYRLSPRRMHAQTLACPICGPELTLFEARSGEINEPSARGEDALNRALADLQAGHIVALKGVGGYQLVCRADLEASVAKLRQLKKREAKPFAVMFKDVDLLKEYQVVSPEEEAALLSPAGPIVLLRQREPDANRLPAERGGRARRRLAPGVCGSSPYLGAFLPSSGLHQLLLDELGLAVVTSGNLSDSPLLIDDREMLSFLRRESGLKAVLSHNRPIVVPIDDSVGFVSDRHLHLVRRARGYVPAPIILPAAPLPPDEATQTATAAAPADFMKAFTGQPVQLKVVGAVNREQPDVLAMGADLKASSALLRERSLYLTQPAGDLMQRLNSRFYCQARDHLAGLLNFTPEAVVLDCHPAYQTRRLVECDPALSHLPRLELQHHQAHIASVMAEHGLRACLGFAFDGTGYGTDGSIWGGEVLLCRDCACLRIGSIKAVPALGGDRMAQDAGLMFYNYALSDPTGLLAAALPARARAEVEQGSIDLWRQAGMHGFPRVKTSSAGRLFDVAAFVLGLGRYNRYEGDLACQLEALALKSNSREGRLSSPDLRETELGPEGAIKISEEEHLLFSLDPIKLLQRLCRGMRSGQDPAFLARSFHETLADYILLTCRWTDRYLGYKLPVALSGGCFNNHLLLRLVREKLEAEGFLVYSNQRVPAGDAGLALGQAYLARLYWK